MKTYQFKQFGLLDHFYYLPRPNSMYARYMTKIDVRVNRETGEVYNAVDSYGNGYYIDDDTELQTPHDYEQEQYNSAVVRYLKDQAALNTTFARE